MDDVRLNLQLYWMKRIADYFQENPPPEHEMELRAILVSIRREVKELGADKSD